jgi:hypothetical protein
MAGAARTETNIAPPRLPFISEEDDNDQSLQGFDLRETNLDEAKLQVLEKIVFILFYFK